MDIKVIKSEEQYEAYCAKLIQLSAQPSDGKNKDTIELLELLVANWETANYPVKENDPVELLKFLMENHHLKQTDLVELLGITKSAVSQILSYQKGMSKEVIRKLADRFKVSQEAFNRPYPLKTAAPDRRKMSMEN